MAGRSKSKLPRPETPVLGSPTVDNSKITQSNSQAIGIRIDSYGSTSTSTNSVSVTSQRKRSPSRQSTLRPISAGPSLALGGVRANLKPHTQSRASNWVNDPNNPYRQSLAHRLNTSQQKLSANFAALLRSQSPSTVPSAGAHVSQRSVSPSPGKRTQGFNNPLSTTHVPNPVNAHATTSSSATSKSHHSPSISSAKNKLSSKTAATPKAKRIAASVPNPPANSGSRGERLVNPVYHRSDRDRSLINSQISRIVVEQKNALLQDEEAKHEVIILSNSDDEEASDVIVLEEPAETKSKRTVAERLMQSFSEKPSHSRRAVPAPGESRKPQFLRSLHDMRHDQTRNYVNYQYQAHMSMQPLQWFGTSNTMLSRPSLLLPGNCGSMPYFSANYPSVAAPYFPPLGTARPVGSRLFSTESHSSTNSQFEGMQIDVDESMENLGVQDHARKRLRNVRKWEFTTLGRLYQDSRHHGTRTMDGGTKFTVLSYNLLAPTLLSEHSDNLYKDIDPVCLDWKSRHELFLTELSGFGYPEILCFQEVEATMYKHFYEVPLAKHGYKGVFKKRTKDKVDGCAIFWKQSMFTLISKLSIEYYQPHVPLLDRDNIALLVKLQSKIGKMSKIVVGTTHLLFNPKRNDVKLAQVQVILSELDRFAFSGFSNRGVTIYHPIILTGDFNSEPRSSIVRLVTDGELQYVNELGERPQLLMKKGLNDFLPHYLGVSDQCQHYRVVLERYIQWRQHRRNSFELDLKQQHALVNLFSSTYFQTDEGGAHNAVNPKREELLTELDPAIHSAIINDSNNFGAECTFGAGEISHKLRLCDIYQPKLDRSTENLADFIATTRQKHWVCVDYIFYSKLWSEEFGRRVEGNLKLLKRLGLPTKTQCKDLGRLPSYAVSSDHFPLLAEFILK